MRETPMSRAGTVIRYWTDREYGVRPPTVEVIDERVWDGLRSLIDTAVDDGSFGYRFPNKCDDGGAVFGCNWRAFGLVLRAEVPGIEWPLPDQGPPPTDIILDLLEFCAGAVGEPIKRDYHSFFKHHHLSWNREAGLARFRSDVNRIFARNGVAYELTDDGRARRLLPEPLAKALRSTVFKTGDDETDRLLGTARHRIASPKEDDRRDALEKLWDAFERVKTLEPGADKRRRADALLDRVAVPGTEFREMLGDEALALTSIGNTFRIRHSEVDQERLGSLEHVDYLFLRMFAFVRMVLKVTGRGG